MVNLDPEARMVRWRCNRGMLELDLLLIPFVENKFQSLSSEQKALFIKLLEYEDPLLFGWLMGHQEVDIDELKPIVKLIAER